MSTIRTFLHENRGGLTFLFLAVVILISEYFIVVKQWPLVVYSFGFWCLLFTLTFVAAWCSASEVAFAVAPKQDDIRTAIEEAQIELAATFVPIDAEIKTRGSANLPDKMEADRTRLVVRIRRLKKKILDCEIRNATSLSVLWPLQACF